jgi:hypothetical protein
MRNWFWNCFVYILHKCDGKKDLWVLANLMYRDWVLVLVFSYLHKCDGERELCSWSLMHEIGVLELEV